MFRFADRVGEKAFTRVRAIFHELEIHPPPGLLEVVPGFTTVLLEFAPRQHPTPAEMAPELARRLSSASAPKLATPATIEIPVKYDGPDLGRVAAHHNLSISDVCQIHSGRVYTVFLLGFAPGFPYLGELDSRLHTPRLPEPRPRVEAGSVAIGGEHTGIYPMPTPGGWNIIGHTTTQVFSVERGKADKDEQKMFLLKPGDRVKFVPETIPAAPDSKRSK